MHSPTNASFIGHGHAHPGSRRLPPPHDSGEQRLAERLEQKLEDDYLLWYDVPIGPKQTHPDFVVLHPRRGALILETKDLRLDTITKATRQYFGIAPEGQPKTVMNPLQQARHCAIQVVNALERDPQRPRGGRRCLRVEQRR